MKIIYTLIVLAIVAVGGVFLLNQNKNSSEQNNNSYEPTGMFDGLKKAEDINKQSYTLDLSGKGLTRLTAETFNNNTSVKFLDLSNNNLTGSIPAEIRKMQNLEDLNASHNNLTGIPAEIGQLSHLEKIDFSYNALDTMPQEIANLKNNLKEFNLTGNKYSESQINDLKLQLPNTNIIY